MENLDIQDVLRRGRVEIAFDPVVSIKQKSVIGLEARASAAPAGGAPVPAKALYSAAESRGLTLELDRLLRDRALEAFRDLGAAAAGRLLFLHFETAVVDTGVVGSGRLLERVKALGLEPYNVLIGITESGARDVEALRKFIDIYRGHGFLIALDEVGSGHSNLSRISLARPDVLKVGESLVRDLDREYYKQEILRSLVSLSRKLGALIAVDGVRREEEGIAALDLGVDMLAGPRFAEAADAAGAVEALAGKFKEYQIGRTQRLHQRRRESDALLSALLKDLSAAPPERFDERLRAFLSSHAAVECLYVLDEAGAQITDTVTQAGRALKQNSLFRPARKGADHSLKEYYYLLADTFVNRFASDPYVSLASGSLCVTLSGMFRDARNKNHILCMDVPL